MLTNANNNKYILDSHRVLSIKLGYIFIYTYIKNGKIAFLVLEFIHSYIA